MTTLSQDLVWWVTVIDLPAMAGLFWLIWRTRQDFKQNQDHLQITLDQRCDHLREALHAFKLDVARHYASHNDVRTLEKRLVEHLLRIESKLDQTALKAEGLLASQNSHSDGH